MASDASMTLETITLENGLALRLQDQSRQIAADRWFLCLCARIDVPVDALHLAQLQASSVSQAEMRSVLGDMVVYEKKMERNFVSETDRMAILSECRRSILDNLLPYLSRPDFPGKFILKSYREACQRRKCRPASDASAPI